MSPVRLINLVRLEDGATVTLVWDMSTGGLAPRSHFGAGRLSGSFSLVEANATGRLVRRRLHVFEIQERFLDPVHDATSTWHEARVWVQIK